MLPKHEPRSHSTWQLLTLAFEQEEFLLPEPGKEVRLTFAEGQKLLREEGPEEYRNVSDDEDMSTPQYVTTPRATRSSCSGCP